MYNPFNSMWALSQFRPSRWDPERVQQLQEKRLRSLLYHAVAHSAYYRRAFAGFDLGRCALSDLPTITKATMMEQFDDAVTDRSVTRAAVDSFVDEPANAGKLLHDRVRVCHTSGSQGQPLFLVQDPLVLDVLFACHITRGNVEYPQSSPLMPLRRLIEPERLAIVVTGTGFHPTWWAWSQLPGFLKPFVSLHFARAGDPDVMKKLDEFKPNMVISTPSTLDAWAAGGWRPDRKYLKQLIASSENLTAVARQRIEHAIGVPVIDTYGAGECLFLTNGCHRGLGSHINADWVVVENVDAEGRPVPAGQVGHKILITNLANRVQPLIRYEIGDQVRLATTDCGCGNRLPRIEQVIGRAGDLFWLNTAGHEKSLSPMALLQAFQYFPMIREWQATQIDSHHIHVKLELLPNAELDYGRVKSRINQGLGRAGFEFGDKPRIDFETVPRLVPDETGKFRRVIALPRHSVLTRT